MQQVPIITQKRKRMFALLKKNQRVIFFWQLSSLVCKRGGTVGAWGWKTRKLATRL